MAKVAQITELLGLAHMHLLKAEEVLHCNVDLKPLDTKTSARTVSRIRKELLVEGSTTAISNHRQIMSVFQ